VFTAFTFKASEKECCSSSSTALKMEAVSTSATSVTNYQKILQKTRDAHIFQKSRQHLKILGTRNVTWSKFHT
jgi:hypothetical protein